jgi:uncharacterized protein (UPF0335 family)
MMDDIAKTGVAAQELTQFVERVERLEEEKKAISEDIRDVYAEMKGRGFDVRAVRQSCGSPKRTFSWFDSYGWRHRQPALLRESGSNIEACISPGHGQANTPASGNITTMIRIGRINLGLSTIALRAKSMASRYRPNRAALDVRLTTEDLSELDRWFLRPLRSSRSTWSDFILDLDH